MGLFENSIEEVTWINSVSRSDEIILCHVDSSQDTGNSPLLPFSLVYTVYKPFKYILKSKTLCRHILNIVGHK